MSTVVNHLCEAIKVGLPVNVRRLGVTEEIEGTIINTIRKPPVNSGKKNITHYRLVRFSSTWCIVLLFTIIVQI